MKKKKRKQKETTQYEQIFSRMKGYEKRGVELFLGGEVLSAREIADVCAVREHGAYMGDYIWGEDGKLSQVRYNRVETGDGDGKT